MNLDIFLFSQINPVKDFFAVLSLIDKWVFNGVNNLALKYLWLDTLGIFLAQYLPWVLIGILILFLLKNFKKYWKMVSLGILAAVFARIITEIIHWLWYRPRPFVENQINSLLSHSPTSSFPSGHATFFFALSTIVYFYNKKAGIFFFLASFLIVLARVFTGLHWPLDILGGVAVGIFSAWFLNKIFSTNH